MCEKTCCDEPAARDPTKLTTPLRWKVEDQCGIRLVSQVPIVGTIVSKKLSYKDVVTARSAADLKEKKVCIGGRALREAPM